MQWSEGLFDDFWKSKNVSAREFLKGDTVIVLAREGNRCYGMGEKVSIPLAMDHYRDRILFNCSLQWRATFGSFSKSGKMRVQCLELGELTAIGAAEMHLPMKARPYRFRLEASLHHNGVIINNNDWSLWAFPEARPEIAAIPNNFGGRLEDGTFLRLGSSGHDPIPKDAPLVLADSVDESLAKYLERGGRCILFNKGTSIESSVGGKGPWNPYRLFRTIPWNAGDHGNSGTVIVDHPALKEFPHEGR